MGDPSALLHDIDIEVTQGPSASSPLQRDAASPSSKPHSADLQLGDDGLLIDGKTGRVVNGLGATRFDVKLAALRGDLDPKPWEENTERAPGVLLGSLVTFPADYTFQVCVGGGCHRRIWRRVFGIQLDGEGEWVRGRRRGAAVLAWHTPRRRGPALGMFETTRTHRLRRRWWARPRAAAAVGSMQSLLTTWWPLVRACGSRGGGDFTGVQHDSSTKGIMKGQTAW